MDNKQKMTIGGSLLLLIIAVVAGLLGIDTKQLGGTTDSGGGDIQINVGEEPVVGDTSWYDIYFTHPTCGTDAPQTGGIDELLAADIRLAEFQVDMAAFEFDSHAIAEALIEVHKRGVYVRVVTDEDYEDEEGLLTIEKAGIDIVLDGRRALMHNKFVAIDADRVWTGSMNFTPNGVYCNNNNLVRIRSVELAENYMTEMDEMFNDKQFGPSSPENTPFEQFEIQGVKVENYFSAETDIAPILARAIARSRNEILFMAFSFTDPKVGQAMMGRAEGGVQVRGVFETVGSGTEYSYYTVMNEANLANIQIRQDGNNRIMHHKVIIIDRETVIFGSYNFSDNANLRNDENLVIIHDPTFASFFVGEFETVWSEAKH